MAIHSFPQTRTCVFFVATPLHYLAARAIANQLEQDSRHVLVYYKPGLATHVDPTAWDAVLYMPWPRFEPLPGLFGRLRRLRENLRRVNAMLGSPSSVCLHSPVFDTEAINYFLNGIPQLRPGTRIEARLLPDGLLNVRRHPLSLVRRVGQCIRKLRRLVAQELSYRCFSGDRTGAEASFVDRIYVLRGFPHHYPLHKAQELPSLVGATPPAEGALPRRALVIGQPLGGVGMLRPDELARLTQHIATWLDEEGYKQIDYQPHPRDSKHELSMHHYTILKLNEPLEIYLSHSPYSIIVGVSSTILPLARQICPPFTRIVSFGLTWCHFKHKEDQEHIQAMFQSFGIELQ